MTSLKSKIFFPPVGATIESLCDIHPRALCNKEFHIWKIRLEASEESLSRLLPILSDKERNRADRFQQVFEKKRYIVFRGLLKKILSNYINIRADRIEFDTGEYGKPQLPRHINSRDLRFSLSRSSEFALYSFAAGQDLGVDIERIKAIPDTDSIAARHFTPKEIEIYNMLEPDEKFEWFYTLWTRKESLIKAMGTGLSHPLIMLDLSTSGRICVAMGQSDEARTTFSYQVEDLPIVPGYKAALAVCCGS